MATDAKGGFSKLQEAPALVAEATASRAKAFAAARRAVEAAAPPAQPVPVVEAVPVAPPPEPMAEATYARAADHFGVMRHVDPVRDHYFNVQVTLEGLRRVATQAPQPGARSLLERVREYLRDHEPGEHGPLLRDLGVDLQRPAALLAKAVPPLGEKFTAKLRDDPAKPGQLNLAEVEHNTHSALFGAGAAATDDIHTMEALRLALTRVRRRQQERLARVEVQLADLDAAIAAGRTRLEALDRDRAEALDDYAVAQRLLADHWRAVERAFADRRRTLEGHLGVWYVKVRETPVAVALPDPLPLRFSAPGDLVPGCPDRDAPLPADLAPFMDAVLDVPASDWAALRGLAHLLPPRPRLEAMVAARRQRVAQRLAEPATAARLAPLQQEARLVAREVAARPFGASSARELQRQGHDILSLEDLLAVPAPLLREPAQTLHRHLDAAAGCLLARLRSVAPSLRLGWAAAAESNRLPVETPERWSGLAEAEGADFEGVRTLAELVGWWFRQLHADASDGARVALRNLVRACFMLAAGDDPEALLRGRLLTAPLRLRVGEPLRLALDRAPPPGAVLQVLDAAQRVVATVRFAHHDEEEGTLASVAAVVDPSAVLAGGARVTGRRSG